MAVVVGFGGVSSEFPGSIEGDSFIRFGGSPDGRFALLLEDHTVLEDRVELELLSLAQVRCYKSEEGDEKSNFHRWHSWREQLVLQVSNFVLIHEINKWRDYDRSLKVFYLDSFLSMFLHVSLRPFLLVWARCLCGKRGRGDLLYSSGWVRHRYPMRSGRQ